MESIAVPSTIDSAVDAAIAAVTAQVALADAALQASAPAPAPALAPTADVVPPEAAPPPAAPALAVPPGSVLIKGVVVSPETHLFGTNGAPLLTPTGRPRLKPQARTQKQNAAAKVLAAPPAPFIKKPEATADASSTPAVAFDLPPRISILPSPNVIIVGTHDAAPPAPPAAPPVQVSTMKPTTATVSKVFGKIGLPETKDVEIAVQTFVTPPAMVELGYGLTLNIGNFESARIDVRLSVPCYREEADDAFAFAKKWTEERIQAEVQAIRKLASGTKTTTPF